MSNLSRIFSLLVVLTLSSCGAGTGPVQADLIFYSGEIWTGAAATEAVAVRGERILATGALAQLEPYRGGDTEMVDLGNRFLMPGFIDNHSHFVDGGFKLQSVNLRSAASEQEFAERIRTHAQGLSEGKWITGGDWDHEAWPSRQIPNRTLIDAFTLQTPVFVTRLDGHMGLANTLALRLAGVTRATPDPPGGAIVRDSSGEPTGVLKDAAMNLVTGVIPPESDESIRRATKLALLEAARLGVTTVNAMSNSREIRIFQQIERAGELTTRLYAITPLEQFDQLRQAGIERNFGTAYLRLGAVKGFVDGSLGSTTAWFHEPYSDAPGSHGLPSPMWFPEGNLRKWIMDADRAGLQLVIHAIGDRANDELLAIFEELEAANGSFDRRYRIEHAQHLTREAIDKIAALGVIASMQPYHAIDDGRWAGNRIGSERIKTTYAFRSLLEAGATVTFGSDWTVAPMSPLLGIYAAVTRRTLDGANPEGWVPEEKLTVEEALLCYTRNNAYAMFADHQLGTIESGKLADLVILSKSPFSVDPSELESIEVVRTIVGGATVYPVR